MWISGKKLNVILSFGLKTARLIPPPIPEPTKHGMYCHNNNHRQRIEIAMIIPQASTQIIERQEYHMLVGVL